MLYFIIIQPHLHQKKKTHSTRYKIHIYLFYIKNNIFIFLNFIPVCHLRKKSNINLSIIMFFVFLGGLVFIEYKIGLKLINKGKSIISVKFVNYFINSITRKGDMIATFFDLFLT